MNFSAFLIASRYWPSLTFLSISEMQEALDSSNAERMLSRWALATIGGMDKYLRPNLIDLLLHSVLFRSKRLRSLVLLFHLPHGLGVPRVCLVRELVYCRAIWTRSGV